MYLVRTKPGSTAEPIKSCAVLFGHTIARIVATGRLCDLDQKPYRSKYLLFVSRLSTTLAKTVPLPSIFAKIFAGPIVTPIVLAYSPREWLLSDNRKQIAENLLALKSHHGYRESLYHHSASTDHCSSETSQWHNCRWYRKPHAWRLWELGFVSNLYTFRYNIQVHKFWGCVFFDLVFSRLFPSFALTKISIHYSKQPWNVYVQRRKKLPPHLIQDSRQKMIEGQQRYKQKSEKRMHLNNVILARGNFISVQPEYVSQTGEKTTSSTQLDAHSKNYRCRWHHCYNAYWQPSRKKFPTTAWSNLPSSQRTFQ